MPATRIPPIRGRGRPSQYHPDMAPFLALRAEGATYRSIAAAIHGALGREVSTTSVRRWANSLEEGVDPAAEQEAPTATDRINIYLTPSQREALEDGVHLVRRGTARQLKLTPGLLARDLIQAALQRGLLEDLQVVNTHEEYERALCGHCVRCGSAAHSTGRHPSPRRRRKPARRKR